MLRYRWVISRRRGSTTPRRGRFSGLLCQQAVIMSQHSWSNCGRRSGRAPVNNRGKNKIVHIKLSSMVASGNQKCSAVRI